MKRRTLAIPLLVIVIAHSLAAADEDPILFRCDFESTNWFEAWGLSKAPDRTATLSADAARKLVPHAGNALRIRVDEGGHYGLSLIYEFKKRTGSEPEEIYFRYYLRLGDDWDPAGGGKFPGIAGTYGRAGWGGRPVDGTDGWSARGLFLKREEGKTPVGFYCYHADMKGKYGDHWRWEVEDRGALENNRWYCIEQFAKMNTPGKNDGVLRAWIDGKLAFDKSDVRMRDDPKLKIETIWVNIYYGGRWTAKSNQHLFIDDVVISRAPIGLAPAAVDE